MGARRHCDKLHAIHFALQLDQDQSANWTKQAAAAAAVFHMQTSGRLNDGSPRTAVGLGQNAKLDKQQTAAATVLADTKTLWQAGQ